ncbi:MAG: hypothetical protein A2W19_16645 [Spirochaetes bacterium RBG_16_49_21]|nr:MAG: hypothetical protein A2W19_16645 [Spirochaetes bacterium RBG_16_49_21]
MKSFFQDLFNNLNQSLKPEYFNLSEPINRSFEKEGIDSAINLWLSKKKPLMLRRKNKPKYIVDINWRSEKGLDERLFPWKTSVWLNYAAGDNLANELFRFLIRHFNPGFGLLTTYDDNKEKHFISYETNIGIVEKYIGIDIFEKEEILPGIYWVTYFNSWAIKKLGKEKFNNLSAHQIESYNNGYIITSYNSSKIIGTQEAYNIENKIKEHLGVKYFFNKNNFDVDKTR